MLTMLTLLLGRDCKVWNSNANHILELVYTFSPTSYAISKSHYLTGGPPRPPPKISRKESFKPLYCYKTIDGMFIGSSRAKKFTILLKIEPLR